MADRETPDNCSIAVTWRLPTSPAPTTASLIVFLLLAFMVLFVVKK